MLQRKAATEKLLLLGVDGLDPRLTKKYVDKGLMPNVKQYIDRGACREDLAMLGGRPHRRSNCWMTTKHG